jgi:wobble nucleotide-excising tRNase
VANDKLLPALSNLDVLKEDLWKAYISSKKDLYLDLLQKYQDAEKRKREIEEEASKQRTDWERVIDIFNDRFFVPFKLIAKNRIPVILGSEPILSLGFTFFDGTESVSVEKSQLMQVLSTGEKKALYILNIIFEIEARTKAGVDTLLVVDDIADSFDYKNKYAIIQYLLDIAQRPNFKQIILTHNFDFFRTVNGRALAKYSAVLWRKKTRAAFS